MSLVYSGMVTFCWSSVFIVSCPSTMDFLFQFLFSPLPTSAIISLFALAAATLFYLHSRPSPVRSPVDLDNQSVGIKVKGTQLLVIKDLYEYP